MSSSGHTFDNILADRLWRTVKYEEVYLRKYGDGYELIRSLRRYFDYYNNHQPHSSLAYRTPAEVYFEGRDSLCFASQSERVRRIVTAYTKYEGKIGLDNGQEYN